LRISTRDPATRSISIWNCTRWWKVPNCPDFALLYLPPDSRRLHFWKIGISGATHPYLRTPEHLSLTERIDQMAEIVEVVGLAGRVQEYPIVTSQILCMHSRLPYEVK